MRALDDGARVELTLMFTDIVGSTRLVTSLGDDAWMDVLRWHDATLRRLFAAHMGYEVKHLGDGFFTVFDDADFAIACAIDIRRALEGRGDRHGVALQIRIGVHRSSVIRDGDDYRGRGVHEAARILASAKRAEIVVSTVTLAEARHALPASAPRRVALRGLPEPIELVSITDGPPCAPAPANDGCQRSPKVQSPVPSASPTAHARARLPTP